jgi:hypothetical protein
LNLLPLQGLLPLEFCLKLPKLSLELLYLSRGVLGMEQPTARRHSEQPRPGSGKPFHVFGKVSPPILCRRIPRELK